jgi:CRP/FNR family transcriptional regulator, cyclic AMP receptor protein
MLILAASWKGENIMSIKDGDIRLIPVFEGIAQETREKIKEAASIVRLQKNQHLFMEREEINNIYIILKGKVTMYRNAEEGHKRVIYILSDGTLINEVIFDGRSASICCEAFEESTIISIPRDSMLKIMEFDFVLTRNIINSMSRKIRRLYRQLKNTTTLRVDKKVAAKLWKLSTDHGIEVEEGVLINLNITITYLADMLGHTRESISRAIKTLEEEKLITLKERKIIVNRERLLKFFRTL